MKQHLVNIWYDTPYGSYVFIGLINEEIGDNGKAVVKPVSLFRKAFGFDLPFNSTIMLR